MLQIFQEIRPIGYLLVGGDKQLVMGEGGAKRMAYNSHLLARDGGYMMVLPSRVAAHLK